MNTALDELRTAITDLQRALAELVMTVREDQPEDSDLAALDSLAEAVCEVQAAAAAAGEQIDAVADAWQLPVALPLIDAAVAQCISRYWHDLRTYDSVHRLRLATRGRGREWVTWHRGLEESKLRCEGPLQRSGTAVSAAWREIGETLSLYLRSMPASQIAIHSHHPAQAFASAAPTIPRRPS